MKIMDFLKKWKILYIIILAQFQVFFNFELTKKNKKLYVNNTSLIIFSFYNKINLIKVRMY